MDLGKMNLPARAAGLLRFIKEWAADPRSVGAVAPSGTALAKLITSQIGPATGPVIELGPGTGVFTKALIERGVAEADLTLVENNPAFATMLRARFPRAHLVPEDAAALGSLNLPGAAGAVISGLPLLNLSASEAGRIVASAFANMRPDAGFFQFTYGMTCPIPSWLLDRLHLRAERIGGTFRNVPPAAVYRIYRRHASHRGCLAW